MINIRDNLVQNVFHYTESSKIHIPVHFDRIMNNIHKQLNIKKNSWLILHH